MSTFFISLVSIVLYVALLRWDGMTSHHSFGQIFYIIGTEEISLLSPFLPNYVLTQIINIQLLNCNQNG